MWRILILALMALGCVPASAQADEQSRRRCFGDFSDNQNIAGCDALISSGRLSGRELADALGARAAAYGRKGLYPQALSDYEAAIRINSQDPKLFTNRAWTYHSSGQYSRAIQDATEALRYDPNSWEAYFCRGLSHARQERHDLAIPDFDLSVRLKPDRNPAIRHRQQSAQALVKTGGRVPDAPRGLPPPVPTPTPTTPTPSSEACRRFPNLC